MFFYLFLGIAVCFILAGGWAIVHEKRKSEMVRFMESIHGRSSSLGCGVILVLCGLAAIAVMIWLLLYG